MKRKKPNQPYHSDSEYFHLYRQKRKEILELTGGRRGGESMIPVNYYRGFALGRSGGIMIPQPEDDPAFRDERIAKYTERASQGLPLFD